jgi:DNA-binding CsgD family transcriptional regulator
MPAPLYLPLAPSFHGERIQVWVCHGVPLIRAGIRAFLSSSSEFEVVASCGACTGGVLIGDLEAGMSALGTGDFGRRVLIVGGDEGEAAVRKAIRMGVRGFLLDTCDAEELRDAVRTLSRGGTVFAAAVMSTFVQGICFKPLTARQLEILQLMVHGFSDKDMARKLVISPGTVKSHMKAILTRLGAARRTEAAAIAQRRGLVRVDNSVAAAASFKAAPVPSRTKAAARAGSRGVSTT